DLQIRIWSRLTNKIIASDRELCKLCLADDMLNLAHRETDLVLDKAFANVPPAGALPPKSSGGPAGETTSPKRSLRWLGWTLGGAGVVAGVTSAILFAKNNDKTDCHAPSGDSDPCASERRTTVSAISFGVAALGGIVSGALILLRGD